MSLAAFHSGILAHAALDRSYAHLKNSEQNIDGEYRSNYNRYDLGYGYSFEYLRLGLLWTHFNINDDTSNDISYEIVATPIDEFTIGYRRYSDTFYLDISAFILKKKFILPIGYRKEIKQFDFHLNFEDIFYADAEYNLLSPKDRHYVTALDLNEYGRLEARYQTRHDELQEFILNAERNQVANLNIGLYQNVVQFNYAIYGFYLAARRIVIKTSDSGFSDGEYIQANFMDIEYDMMDFAADADIAIMVDSYSVGLRRRYTENFRYQIGFQHSTIKNLGGRYGYNVTLQDYDTTIYSDSDLLEFDTIKVAIITGGVEYTYGNLGFRYSLAQYVPIVDLNKPDEPEETGEPSQKRYVPWWQKFYNDFIQLRNTLRDYQGGNYHRIEIVYYF